MVRIWPTGDRTGRLPRQSSSDLYAALDRAGEHRARGGKGALGRGRVIPLALAVLAFGAGVLLDATLFHFGDHTRAANVVIGQRVIRDNPSPQRTVPRAPPSPAASLTWGGPVLVDPSGPLRSVSCPNRSFCAAVDGRGQAVVYAGGRWSPPVHIDGANQINSVSCAGSAWCAAVDQAGDAIFYDGSKWAAPQRIDTTEFPELTAVSCSSPSFCAAVDGRGNALVYDGRRWSPPEQVDPAGWSTVSRDVPSISCPSDGSCVGVDPENNAFFYESGTWQLAASIDRSTGPPTIKLPNAVSCASDTFCVATDNPGDVEAYDGTQWSNPVAADPANYLATISCASASFCVGVDSLLPAGFNTGSGGSGQVVTYNGVGWSSPRPIDEVGLISSVSCPDAQYCTAVDSSGHVVTGAAPSGGRNPDP